MKKNRKIHTYNRVTLLYTAKMVKNPPAMQETWVQFLGWEDALEGRAWQPTPGFLPGESPWTEELEGYSSWSREGSDMTE